MQSNYFSYSNRGHRYHPYATQPYPVNYHGQESEGDFSSDVYLGGDNYVPYPQHEEGREGRFNNRGHRGRFQNRGRFGHRGRGRHHQQNQQQHSQHKPWMTDEVLEAIRERNELQRKAEETKNPDDWSIFKAVRNRTNMLISDARRVYEMSMPQNEGMDGMNGHNQGQGVKGKPVCAFYCDTCDRSFANDTLLQEHNAEHVVCQLDGCKFTAHPKIILKHIEMQHSNNLFSRVKGFDSPEEMEKWKAERRAKYPTPDNMRLKEEEMAERNKRGERLPLRNHDGTKKNFRGPKEFIRPERSNRREPYDRRNRKDNFAGPGPRRNSFSEKEASQPGEEVASTNGTQVRPPKPAFTFGTENLPSDSSKRSKSEVLVLESFYALIKICENGALVGKKMMPWDSETQSLCQKISRTGKPLKRAEEDGSLSSDDYEEEDEANVITDEEEAACDVIPSVPKQDIEPLETAESTPTPLVVKEEKQNGPPSLGLVAYSSDSDDEAPEERPTDSCREEGEIVEEENAVVVQPETVEEENAVVVQPETVEEENAVVVQPETVEEENAVVQGETISRIDPVQPEETVVTEKPNTSTAGGGKFKVDTGKDNKVKQMLKNTPGRGIAKNAPVFKKRQPRVPKLLKKLLENDIRRERNQILQVCRFIIENNFFDDGPAGTDCKKETSESNEEAQVTVSVCSDQNSEVSEPVLRDDTRAVAGKTASDEGSECTEEAVAEEGKDVSPERAGDLSAPAVGKKMKL